MKKLLMVLFFGAAMFACRDRSERAAERDIEDRDEYVAPDTDDEADIDTTYEDRTRMERDTIQ